MRQIFLFFNNLSFLPFYFTAEDPKEKSQRVQRKKPLDTSREKLDSIHLPFAIRLKHCETSFNIVKHCVTKKRLKTVNRKSN